MGWLGSSMASPQGASVNCCALGAGLRLDPSQPALVLIFIVFYLRFVFGGTALTLE